MENQFKRNDFEITTVSNFIDRELCVPGELQELKEYHWLDQAV